jgi:hypothetical protein
MAHSAIVGKVRQTSILADDDRKKSITLIDKMAALAGQVALVARMGEDDLIDERFYISNFV